MDLTKKINLMPVLDIGFYEKNAKKHSEEQIEKIAKSILEFGFSSVLLVDKNNTLIAGHGRMKAIELINERVTNGILSGDKMITKVPVIVKDDLTDAQVKAFRLADNKVSESEWDFSIVREELFEINEMELDISLTGFNISDTDINPEAKKKGSSEKVSKIGHLEITCPKCQHTFSKAD